MWILDGASIHMDKNFSEYLRDCGLHVIFLPAYCPFYNPIEYLFGHMKREFKRQYAGKGSEQETLLNTLSLMSQKHMRSIYAHCGYSANGLFNPLTNLCRN